MVQDAQVMRALWLGCDIGFVLSQPVYFVRSRNGTCQIREAPSHIPLTPDHGEPRFSPDSAGGDSSNFRPTCKKVWSVPAHLHQQGNVLSSTTIEVLRGIGQSRLGKFLTGLSFVSHLDGSPKSLLSLLVFALSRGKAQSMNERTFRARRPWRG